MSQLENFPRFRGDGSEDADGWLRKLVAATGHFNDSGIFRFLSTQLEDGSPARGWYNQLDEASRTSWGSFERTFRARWITPASPPLNTPWERFRKHSLSVYDHLFDGDSSATIGSTCAMLSFWAEEHLAIGRATGRSDQVLIETSKHLIPPFIRAHIEVSNQSRPATLAELCTAIGQITPIVVETERVRRRETTEDWKEKVEQRLQDISDNINKVLDSVGGGAKNLDHMDQPPNDAPGHMVWEPSSELDPTTSRSRKRRRLSDMSLPVVRTGSLPRAVELVPGGSGQDINMIADVPLDLRVPVGWRKPVVTVTRSEIVAISKRLIDYILLFSIQRERHDQTIDGIILPPHQLESFAAGLALYDKLTGSSIYMNKVFEILSTARLCIDHQPLDRKSYDWAGLGWRGLTMMYGFRAYQHPRMVAGALSRWDDMEKRTVKRDQKAVNGYSILQNEEGEASCAGFVITDKTLYYIDATETVFKMALSAHLAELTKVTKYKATALLLAKNIKLTMLDRETMLVNSRYIDVRDGTSVSGCFTPSCHLTGVYIEGLSMLASITEDESWTQLMIEVAIAAMNAPEWQDDRGILSVGSEGDVSENEDSRTFKGVLLRGLLAAYQRNPLNTHFCALIRSFVNVQFNALRDLSREGDAYGLDWRGPYQGPFLHAQLAVLDAMIAAIGVQAS